MMNFLEIYPRARAVAFGKVAAVGNNFAAADLVPLTAQCVLDVPM